MKAIIIAGGLGTRLRPLTYNIPKPIVWVVNRPFIVHQIEKLVDHGISEIIVNLHYLSHEIKKILGDGRKWGIKIRYSIEKTPLGTAGAVKNAEEFFDDEPMVVLNGDILTDFDLSRAIEFHRHRNATVTIALTEVDDPTPFGLILTDRQGRITDFIEKPSWQQVTAKTINAGIYIIDPKIFKIVPKGRPFSFERELYPILLAQEAPIYGYKSSAYWIDIGNSRQYREAHQAILLEEVSVKILGSKVKGKCWIGKGTRTDKTVKFVGQSVLGDKVKLGKHTEIHEGVAVGNNVTIGTHCMLERAIVWPDCKIGNSVKLVDCVIGSNCQIEDEVVIRNGAVIADNSVIRKGSQLAA
jgi:mannose-1-phosphate guanylyltransferase/phosphomannomutase